MSKYWGGRDPFNPCGADAYGVLETAKYETVFVVIRATIILSANTVIWSTRTQGRCMQVTPYLSKPQVLSLGSTATYATFMHFPALHGFRVNRALHNPTLQDYYNDAYTISSNIALRGASELSNLVAHSRSSTCTFHSLRFPAQLLSNS